MACTISTKRTGLAICEARAARSASGVPWCAAASAFE
jgi:hypothetical protein